MAIQDITPVRPSAAERNAARLSLAKSRFFLILGLGTQMGYGPEFGLGRKMRHRQIPASSTICTCEEPDAVLKIIRLQSRKMRLSGGMNARFRIKMTG